MTLKDKLKEDLKSAMKEKDTIRKNVVQLIKAGVLQVEKDSKVTLDDDGVLGRHCKAAQAAQGFPSGI